jgi:hypothetical protein
MNSFKKNSIIKFSIIYYYIVMWVMKFHYDDFQHLNFIFSQNFISQFWGLFNGETDLRVRHLEICHPNLFLLE